jgi:hypothetical protein
MDFPPVFQSISSLFYSFLFFFLLFGQQNQKVFVWSNFTAPYDVAKEIILDSILQAGQSLC